jgi:hypothetical protein
MAYKTMDDKDIYKIEQMRYEHDMWERLLDFFKQENVWLKTRLAHVLDNSSDKFFLARAELYQNQFIANDELINALQQDTADLTVECEKRISGIKNIKEKKMEERHGKLRNELARFEKNFTLLRNEFNEYLLSVL